MRVYFGHFELDDDRYLLREEGERVRVRPKVFDLLVHLVRCRERVVLRDELVSSLWGGMAVGTGSLSGLVNELRQVLGEDGRGPSSIRTVHARGYQFVGAVMERTAAVREVPGRPPPVIADECPADPSQQSARFASRATELSTLAVPLRNALEEVPTRGARALFVECVEASQQTLLLDRARRVIERAGFEVQFVPRVSAAEGGTTCLVDRVVRALAGRHGFEQIRSMLPVHARVVMEGSASQSAIRRARSRDPLAARQQEEGVWRGLADVLRRLARAEPLAVVVEEIDLAGEVETPAIAALLRLLSDADVLLLGGVDRMGEVRAGQGPWVGLPDDLRSRIDLVEVSLPDPGKLDMLVEREGCSALPAVLADALLEHARSIGDIDLDSVAEWLRVERGSVGLVASDSSRSVIAAVERARHMRRVPADTMKRRSSVESG